jgi:hypothetical protein
MLYDCFISVGNWSKECRSKGKNNFFEHLSNTCLTNVGHGDTSNHKDVCTS